MKTFEIKELVEDKPGITITLVPGFGEGYNEVQQGLIDGHVQDVVGQLREFDRAAVIIISPMNTNTPVRAAELKMVSLALPSDIVLLVTPTHVRVDKWRGYRDRVGCFIGN